MLLVSKEILRSSEVARLLGVTRKTVWKWTVEGKIKAIRLPSGEFRYRREDVEEFMKRMREWRSSRQ